MNYWFGNPQKSRPIPSPALKSMAIQLPKPNSGSAFWPPNLMAPNLPKPKYSTKITNTFAAKITSQPKLFEISIWAVLKSSVAYPKFARVQETKKTIKRSEVKNLRGAMYLNTLIV